MPKLSDSVTTDFHIYLFRFTVLPRELPRTSSQSTRDHWGRLCNPEPSPLFLLVPTKARESSSWNNWLLDLSWSLVRWHSFIIYTSLNAIDENTENEVFLQKRGFPTWPRDLWNNIKELIEAIQTVLRTTSINTRWLNLIPEIEFHCVYVPHCSILVNALTVKFDF